MQKKDMNPEQFLSELECALDTFDQQKVKDLCDQLSIYLSSCSAPYPLKISKKILGGLRRKRHFKLMLKIADQIIQTGQKNTYIHREYAQALLDNGLISAALDKLAVSKKECLAEKNGSSLKELNEIQGLIGRAKKQLFINATKDRQSPLSFRKSLMQAISSYINVYKKDKGNIWHGVNSVALIELAKRRNIALYKSFPSSMGMAKEILEQIESKESCNLWDYASAAEVCLALKDYTQAITWVEKYTSKSSEADAFEYASTLRQFEEVWQLDESDGQQSIILSLLRATLLQQQGGEVEIKNIDQSLQAMNNASIDEGFEKIFGDERFQKVDWIRDGLERAKGVVSIYDNYHSRRATGFLMKGKKIHPSIKDKWVIVTNAHAISDEVAEQNFSQPAFSSDEVYIKLNSIDTRYRIKKIIYSSGRNDLDCTILSLQTELEISGLHNTFAKKLTI